GSRGTRHPGGHGQVGGLLRAQGGAGGPGRTRGVGMNGEPMSSEHTDVGAYALGLPEPRDRQAFEEHLAGCPAGAAELAELSGMKSLLSDLGPVEAPAGEPAEANVADLVRRRAESQRRHSRRQVLLGAAAAAGVPAGGGGRGPAGGGPP